MRKFSLYAIVFTLTYALSVAGGAMAGDAKKGKRVFNKCKACHTLEKGKNRIGPHLAGIIGRKAGSVDGFRYSKAMKESGIVWTEETLDEYLRKPRAMVKGTKMAFPGLRKESERENLIEFLEQAAK